MSDDDTEIREPSYVRVPLGNFHRHWLERNYPTQRSTTHRIRAAAEEGLLYRRFLKGTADPTEIVDSLNAAGEVIGETDYTFADDWQVLDVDDVDAGTKDHRVKLPATFLDELEHEYAVHIHTSHQVAAAVDDAMLWRELIRRRASAPRVDSE